MLLKFLAIFIGIIIAITRGYGTLFPTKMAVAVTRLVSNPPVLRMLGIFMFCLAFLVFAALGTNVAGARLLMLFIAISILSGGFVLTFWSKRYVELVEWFLNLPEPTLRILYGTGFALGVALIVVGISYY